MINAGIVGGSGYTAGELIRLLIHHPEVAIDFVYSTSRAGEEISDVHRDLLGDIDLRFTSKINDTVDVLFLCMGHGNAMEFLKRHPVSNKMRIIDLSRDFRFSAMNTFDFRTFVYGLPELQKERIENAHNIANPGCFATAIQLALLPLAQNTSLDHDIHVHGITGATGAGSTPSGTTHFSWRDNNVSIYKALNHQHIGEISQSLEQLSHGFSSKVNFVPVRGNFSRGIFVTAYTQTDLALENAETLYSTFYSSAPYVHLSPEPLYLKQVVNTNKCLLHLQKKDGQLLITSIIDNLLKGASGQAVQNMNLMFGMNESTGLQLKPSHF